MQKYCYFNGKIVEAKKAGLPLDDIGILRGFGIFDYFWTYNGKAFEFSSHYRRFTNSAKKLGMKIPVTQNALEKILMTLLKKNKLENAAFRLVLTGGQSSNKTAYENKSNFYILCEIPKPLDPKLYSNGAKILTHKYLRQIPESKNSNYIESVLMQPLLKRAGATEVLYHHDGKILEFSTSNVFIVKKGRVITPSKNILEGITRKKVLELARKNKIPVEIREVKLNELFKADEVFLTASNKKVLPVVKIDDKKVADGKIGPITKFLMTAFGEYTKNYMRG